MTTLADFLATRQDAILELFTARAQDAIAHGALTRVELVDHLPQVLEELAATLAAGDLPADLVFARSGPARAHGRQRLRAGYDLDALVREYGLLHDCIFQRLEEARVVPTLRELRVVSDFLSAARAESVRQYVRERHTEEERLRAAQLSSEQRYRTLFASIDDGVALIDVLFDGDRAADYRFVETNAAFESHTGLKDAQGRTVRELIPDLDPSWFERYGRVASTGEPTRFENYAAALGRWFDVYASRVGPPELRQVALVFKDVTSRRHVAEEQQRLLAFESVARQRAEEANRVKDEFLATVSHELRTPLTSILGWVQMLRTGTVPPERQATALETVERNARAQAQLIEDLLDVSRILSGELRLAIAPVAVRTVVEAALEAARPAATAKGIAIETTFASEDTVMGDPRRLQQVVWNLLSNAVKFSPKGATVWVLLEARDSSVEIAVADTGPGIPRDFQRHLFEPFRQADGSITRAHGGLGLGLSLVRQLVEMHGGTVSVVSEGEATGASFQVRLPRVAPRRGAAKGPPPLSASTQPPDATEASGLDGLHVLVVEDEEDAREMLRMLLASAGARVSVAASAADALRAFSDQSPELLLSDIGLPGEDGYALIGKIRALPHGNGAVPAVALTAYARPEDRARALAAGFDDHVAKPVNPPALIALLASLPERPRRPP